jgi:hypothetical protein
LTNIAVAIRTDPELFKAKLGRLVWMGGASSIGGNAKAWSEANGTVWCGVWVVWVVWVWGVGCEVWCHPLHPCRPAQPFNPPSLQRHTILRLLT